MAAAAEQVPQPTEDVLPAVYEELRAIAHSYFRNQPPSFTLRPTDIVDEACLHLLRQGPAEWDGPQHFRAIATRKVWQVIIDHLKHRHARKRGGAGAPARDGAAAAPPVAPAERVPLESVAVEWGDRLVDLLDLADALEELGGESRRLHDVVMLHWFGGLTHGEVGRVLNVSSSTAEKDFRYALAWLNRRLSGTGHGD